jgi:hypothetical protein
MSVIAPNENVAIEDFKHEPSLYGDRVNLFHAGQPLAYWTVKKSADRSNGPAALGFYEPVE